MHDPDTVAFTICYPWRSGPNVLFPQGRRREFITVWHVDPEKDGSDDSCDWFGNRHRGGLRWHPRWHFWHWRLQLHPIQGFKRWAFTRCAVCGGRFAWGESGVGTWSGTGPRWFRSENLTHSQCYARTAYKASPVGPSIGPGPDILAALEKETARIMADTTRPPDAFVHSPAFLNAAFRPRCCGQPDTCERDCPLDGGE